MSLRSSILEIGAVQLRCATEIAPPQLSCVLKDAPSAVIFVAAAPRPKLVYQSQIVYGAKGRFHLVSNSGKLNEC